jgi:hypothetical protein
MRKRTRRLIAGAILAFLIVVCLRLSLPHDLQLLAEAHEAQYLNSPPQTLTTLHWITPSRYLLFRWDLRQMRRCSDLVSYDLATGNATPMPKLLRALQRAQVDSDNLLISPDGRYLLASGLKIRGATDYIFTIEGATVRADVGYVLLPLFWLPDSRHWVALRSDYGGSRRIWGHVGNMDNSSGVEMGPIEVPGGLSDKNCYTYVSQAGDTLLFCNVPQNGSAPQAALTRIQIGAALRLVGANHVNFPAGSHIDHVAISPRGDYIAWALICHRDSALNRKLRRYLSWPAFQPRDYLAIYLSRPDGSDLHELGAAPCQGLRQRIDFIGGMVGRFTSWSLPDIQNLDWTPDGKNISFTYHDHLYLLPVN